MIFLKAFRTKKPPIKGGFVLVGLADLMGHADTRMVETVYARSRHEGVMKQQNWVEKMNEKYDFTPSVTPENARKT